MYKSTYIYVGIEAWYLVIHSSQCDLEPESFVVVQILVTLAHTHAHTHPHTSPHALVTHTPTHTHTRSRTIKYPGYRSNNVIHITYHNIIIPRIFT